MGKAGCAVFNCVPSSSDVRHRFPNPSKNQSLFLIWLQLMGNIRLNKINEETVYKNHRVCGKHFIPNDYATNNYLKKGVVPTLFLPSASITVNQNIEHDHCYSHPYNHEEILSSSHNEPDPITTRCFTPFEEATNSGNTTPPRIQSEHANIPSIIRRGLLGNIGVSKASELTPKAKSLYKQAYYYKRKASLLTKRKCNFKQRLQAMEKFMKEKSFLNLASNLNSVAYHFIKRQIESIGKKAKGRRFLLEDKILGLALYKQSPAAYKLLSSIFTLPSRVTLQKLLSRVPIFPGIHYPVFNLIKGVAQKMKPLNKHCILMFDEMAIDSNLHYNQHLDEVEGLENFGSHKTENIANHVQVYMLRGITGNWKQPVCYNFVKGGVKGPQIKKNIVEIIKEATTAGLKVVATVCDQGTNNVSAIDSLVEETKLRTGTNDYIFEIGRDKIVPLYDVPHLLKGVRNNLLAKEIHFTKDGKKRIAKWEHIYTAWLMDGFSGNLRAMPKLTEYHVNKDKIKKMKVSVCAQVFSHTVASTMNLLIGNETFRDEDHPNLFLNEEARGTVELIKFFDDLFDSVNGLRQTDIKGKPLRTSTSTISDGPHVPHWKASIDVLNSMYCMDGTKKIIPPTFINWVRTLKGFLLLRQQLKLCGFTRIKTRRFNQDPLENFFGKIRQRGQRFVNPTCSAFGTFYKSLLVNGLVCKQSLGGNCEDDEGNILITLQRFITQGLPEEEVITDEYEEPQSLPVLMISKFLKPLESAALAYVAGDIIKIKTKLKDCIACKYNILKRPDETDDFNKLIKAKEYGGKNLCRLKYCNFEFVKNLTTTYNIIRHLIPRVVTKRKICNYILRVLHKHVNFNFMQCEHSNELQKSILKDFTKLIIHNYFNGINNVMSGKDERALPDNVSNLVREARISWEKKKRYKPKK